MCHVLFYSKPKLNKYSCAEKHVYKWKVNIYILHKMICWLHKMQPLHVEKRRRVSHSSAQRRKFDTEMNTMTVWKGFFTSVRTTALKHLQFLGKKNQSWPLWISVITGYFLNVTSMINEGPTGLQRVNIVVYLTIQSKPFLPLQQYNSVLYYIIHITFPHFTWL